MANHAPDSSDDPAWPTPLAGRCHRVRPWEGEGPARPLAVFFGARDLVPGRFNFPQTGRNLAAHRLFLNNGTNDWYQHGIPGFGADFAACCARLRDWQMALGAGELCLIGTSMGGFGALRYGAALGARVLAFSSDSAIGVPGSQSAAHYLGSRPAPCPDLRPAVMAAPATADLTLIVGERDAADLVAAHQLKGTGRVRVLTVVGADHYVPPFLSRRGLLEPLLRRFVEQGLPPALPDPGSALTAPGHPETLKHALSATLTRDWAGAEAAARTALEQYPGSEAAELLRGRALLELGRPHEAADLLARAWAGQPEDEGTLRLLALAFRRSGAYGRALALWDRVLERNPDDHAAHYARGLVLQAMKHLPEALAAIRRALRAAPGNATYKKRYATLAALADRTGGGDNQKQGQSAPDA